MKILQVLAACVVVATTAGTAQAQVFNPGMKPQRVEPVGPLTTVLRQINASKDPERLRAISAELLDVGDQIQRPEAMHYTDVDTIKLSISMVALRALNKAQALELPPLYSQNAFAELRSTSDDTEAAARSGDAALRRAKLSAALDLPSDEKPSTAYTGPQTFTYPQAPTQEPSWMRAQRAERAQLGSVGQAADQRAGAPSPRPKVLGQANRKHPPAQRTAPHLAGRSAPKPGAVKAPQPAPHLHQPDPKPAPAPLSAAALEAQRQEYLAFVRRYLEALRNLKRALPATAGDAYMTATQFRQMGEGYKALGCPPEWAEADHKLLSSVAAAQVATEELQGALGDNDDARGAVAGGMLADSEQQLMAALEALPAEAFKQLAMGEMKDIVKSFEPLT